jgi:hypothetical protein
MFSNIWVFKIILAFILAFSILILKEIFFIFINHNARIVPLRPSDLYLYNLNTKKNVFQ